MKTPLGQADTLRGKCRRALASHRQWAARDGKTLDYDLGDLLALAAASPQCGYCRMPLSFAFNFDHRTPIARGGRHALDNLAVCCGRCNAIKGQLTEGEYRGLLRVLECFHPAARADVERRLIAGGARYSGSRRGRGRDGL
ncbi:MAG: HNH endonuclease [Gemmataceae bacterium]